MLMQFLLIVYGKENGEILHLKSERVHHWYDGSPLNPHPELLETPTAAST